MRRRPAAPPAPLLRHWNNRVQRCAQRRPVAPDQRDEQVTVNPAHHDVRAHLEVLGRQASRPALAAIPDGPAPETGRRRRRTAS